MRRLAVAWLGVATAGALAAGGCKGYIEAAGADGGGLAEAGAETAAEADAVAEPEAEPAADAVAEPEAEPAFDAEAEAVADAEAEAETAADAPDAEAETDGGPVGCVAADCDDGDPCTEDVCDAAGLCAHLAVGCSDGDACTVDSCGPGGCAHAPLDCDDGLACSVDGCNPVAGAVPAGCTHTALGCDDGDACTADTCDDAGGCVHQPLDCNDSSACTTDVCNAASGCAYLPIDCDDGNACTTDSCISAGGGGAAPGGCTATQITCDDGDACTSDGCDPASGCTAAPLACDDGDPCTTDGCGPAGCTHVPVDCDDADACTVDACIEAGRGGAAPGCTHAALDCDDGLDCSVDGCNPVAGAAPPGCTHTALGCDDGDACTADTCDDDGGCMHAALDCNDGNACTTEVCNAASGCAYTPVTCNDGNACTTDACSPATGCTATQISCNDDNACTTDVCNAASGCAHTPVTCSDGNACTTDACSPATGCTATQISCDDANPCTTDACSPASGCTHTAVTCNDGNACTGPDFCSPTSGCQGGPAVTCNDGDPCTSDACAPSSGCTYAPLTCSDGDACTTDACGPSGCTHTPLACDDADDCTADACSPASGCTHTLLPGCGTPTFTYATACKLPPEPPASGDVALVPAFPDLNLYGVNAVSLEHAGDGTDRLFAVALHGRIHVFDNDPAVSDKSTFLDIESAVTVSAEGGLLDVAFHPDYADNGLFYVAYTVSYNGGPALRIARVAVSPDPDDADESTLTPLFTCPKPSYYHNGGALAFGHDGYLYATIGDGGDTPAAAANTSSCLGKVLRLDVDATSPGKPYAIPPDNPFASGAGGLPEVYAWGFRNPWRMTVDRVTGALWIGDVGESDWEEVDILQGGKHFGWPTMEGTHCKGYGGPEPSCDKTPYVAPVLDYPHVMPSGGCPDTALCGHSITGGYVYRGAALPALYGSYLFADYVDAKVFAYAYGSAPIPTTLISAPPAGTLSGFGEDQDGEVYVLALWYDPPIAKLVPGAPPAPSPIPQTLSATGCFSDLATLTPAPGVVPYDVNAPLWSDYTHKRRFFVLPEGGQITYSPTGKWQVPDGTVFIKHFDLETTPGDPASTVRLETRLMIKESTGVRGYAYRWNDAGTEATLLPGAATRDLEVELPDAPGTVDYTWQFPSRQQCQSCHTAASGGVLSFETGQLNRPHLYPALAASPINQLDALAAWDLFAAAPPDPATALAYPAIDAPAAPLAERVRAYLHSNCANCHLPGGPTGKTLDLRYTTPLADTATCNVAPSNTLGIPGASIVAPGAPTQSVLLARMQAAPPVRMPPLATAWVHGDAVTAVSAWISGLSGCTGP